MAAQIFRWHALSRSGRFLGWAYTGNFLADSLARGEVRFALDAFPKGGTSGYAWRPASGAPTGFGSLSGGFEGWVYLTSATAFEYNQNHLGPVAVTPF